MFHIYIYIYIYIYDISRLRVNSLPVFGHLLWTVPFNEMGKYSLLACGGEYTTERGNQRPGHGTEGCLVAKLALRVPGSIPD